jgi:hypothetical protein
MSLSHLSFVLISTSTGGGTVDLYEWLKVVFLISWLLGLVEDQRRDVVDFVFPLKR